MEILNPICAGMDVHKDSITVCLAIRDGQGKRTEEVRKFQTTTPGLLTMYDWLKHFQCRIVAIESTSIYWKPVFNLLEGEIEVMLVNPAHIKQVPGRKTDMSDAQWIAQLLEHGLLRPSFIPPVEIRDLRDFVRHRSKLIQQRADEVRRVQKLLESANIRLSSVATDVLGVSGRKILNGLLDGVQDPEQLAQLAKGRLRAKKDELAEALQGVLRPHHLHLLSHLLEHIDFLSGQIQECQAEIEEICRPFAHEVELLDSIPGVSQVAAQAILAETGVNMAQFPSSDHLCSWAGIAPGNNESAGKRRSGRIRMGNQHLRSVLVVCAHAAAHTKQTFLGVQFSRFRRRKGVKKAAVAVAHSILEECYYILRDKKPHIELGGDYYERRNHARKIQHHIKQLERLGVTVPRPQTAYS